jgi:hypothetical protein
MATTADGMIGCNAFSTFILNRTEFINEVALRDIVPQQAYVGDVEEGTWPAFMGATRITDRIHYVAPDLRQAWQPVAVANCETSPCDPTRIEIGYGMSRTNTALERIGYKSSLICFDQLMTMTRARDFANTFPDLLRMATLDVIANFRRIKTAELAGTKVLADVSMTPFTFTPSADWATMTTSGEPTSILMPSMLQRLWGPLIQNGAAGPNGWANPAVFKLITDYDTLYGFAHGSGTWAGNTSGWRFTEFEVANELWSKYGLSGKVGQYMVKVDPTPLRFNRTAANTFVRVWPRKTENATVGIKSAYDLAFENAGYQFSVVKHKMAWEHLTLVQGALPNMAFQTRSLSGQWRWANRDLGANYCGEPIDNSDGTKGRWQNDFIFAAEPKHVEWDVLIFHKRTPICITIADRCAPAPAEYTAATSSSNTPCPIVFTFAATVDDDDTYSIAANSITCGGVTLTHAAITGEETVADVASALNGLGGTAALGVWSVSATDPTTLVLTNSGTACSAVVIIWL